MNEISLSSMSGRGTGMSLGKRLNNNCETSKLNLGLGTLEVVGNPTIKVLVRLIPCCELDQLALVDDVKRLIYRVLSCLPPCV